MYSQTATVFGRTIDEESKRGIDFVTIYVEGSSNASESNADGTYRIEIRADKACVLIARRIGYKEARIHINPLVINSVRNINFILVTKESNLEVIIEDSRIEDLGMVREEVEVLQYLPSTTGNFESVLPHIALGTSSGTGGELSSQYNVRGGNYDENLVYVNDFEIYRPQLIRSAQQEGLSFPNIDLIRDLSFSSGGFEAKYGDKLSSVLDIRYKRPEKFGGSASASALGGSFHFEGSKTIGPNSYNKFRYLVGTRYKTTKYLLGTLDITGEYSPNFLDIQTYLSYDISRDWQISYLGNFNSSVYEFIPDSLRVAKGLIDFALQLTSAFEGQEVDAFDNTMSGLNLTYIPKRDKNPIFLKFLAGNYSSWESERIDIIGYYRLSQIETDLTSDDLGEEIAVLGTGIQHEYIRDYFFSNVVQLEHKGGIEFQLANKDKSHFLQWSGTYRNEFLYDRINEWERLDSAGYSLPYDPNNVQLLYALKSNNDLSTHRFGAYIQDTYSIQDSIRELRLNGGIRVSYWDLNKELLVSPRAQILYKPISWSKSMSFKLATGLYQQSPFYREMRTPDGSLNTDLLAQKSFHIVAGMTYDFDWKKVSSEKFKLITEFYYKKLWDLVSYEIDNVRIRYSGENDARGYVMGIDLRVNGEFVPGAESWVNLSVLSAKEQIIDIQHKRRYLGDSTDTDVNFVSRPSDQLVSFSTYFQDYLPRNENFKMNLNLTFGTGLPFGLKGNNVVYRNTYRYPPYHRVDIGFAYMLWKKDWITKKPRHPLRFSKNAWLSVEVYNLLQVSNVASNIWIKTIYNTQYAIPNYLSSRRINLKVKIDF